MDHVTLCNCEMCGTPLDRRISTAWLRSVCIYYQIKQVCVSFQGQTIETTAKRLRYAFLCLFFLSVHRPLILMSYLFICADHVTLKASNAPVVMYGLCTPAQPFVLQVLIILLFCIFTLYTFLLYTSFRPLM